MIATDKLDQAYNFAVRVVNFDGGFDTFVFRKKFESDLSIVEQKEVMNYLNLKIQKKPYYLPNGKKSN